MPIERPGVNRRDAIRELRRAPAWRLVRRLALPIGLAVLAGAIAGAAGPYHQTRLYHEAVHCQRSGGNCLDGETVSVTNKRTYVTTSASTDSQGGVSQTRTTHYSITWRAADGADRSRDVAEDLYDRAREGQPATVRSWHGAMVGIAVGDRTQWFAPDSGGTLLLWVLLGYFGLGLLLWGAFGWWDGLARFCGRIFFWMMAGTPVILGLGYALLYEVQPSVRVILTTVFAAAVTALGLVCLYRDLRYDES
ncbi:hypothetical protein AB0L57_30755 [Nocardia sp. NPDC052254]|uniref:hypothetical protein n=1 Tax=Nocardia sp. NPDC052254 TaxID=3155681 RepID=UPI003441AC48